MQASGFRLEKNKLIIILLAIWLAIYVPASAQNNQDSVQGQIEPASEPFSFESTLPPASSSQEEIVRSSSPQESSASTQEVVPPIVTNPSVPVTAQPGSLTSSSVDISNQTSQIEMAPTAVNDFMVDANPNVHIFIETPAQGQVLNESDVRVSLRTETTLSLPVRFHLFLDNQEPVRVEDLIEPVLFKNLDEGAHVIRVLAVNEEGRAFADSYAVARFFVKKKDFKNMIATHQPYLTVNLPASGSIPATKDNKVYLEFFVHNAKMGAEGNVRVRYTLDGKSAILAEPDAVPLEKLAEGQHRLTVELIDMSENTVLGPFNYVERTFEIVRVLSPLSSQKPAGDSVEDIPEQ